MRNHELVAYLSRSQGTGRLDRALAEVARTAEERLPAILEEDVERLYRLVWIGGKKRRVLQIPIVALTDSCMVLVAVKRFGQKQSFHPMHRRLERAYEFFWNAFREPARMIGAYTLRGQFSYFEDPRPIEHVMRANPGPR